VGQTDQDHLFPNIKEEFWADVDKYTDDQRAGSIDLILFSGDLVQRGATDEFDRFEELMLDVRAQLAPGAVFLAVPGNHDLVRPKAADSAVAGLMQLWSASSTEEASVQDLFWKDATSSQRRVVEKAFANYTDWWQRSVLNPAKAGPDLEPRVHLSDLVAGLLPGDFRATITKGDIRLGIVGLNSTFLQLTGGDLTGRLSVGVPQITSLSPDLPKWVNSHHLAFLMTHQPPDWLTPKARQDLEHEINPPGRFALHLMGHMHASRATGQTFGNSPERRLFQGRSWFGLEYFGGLDESQRQSRSHGYALGRISWQGSELHVRIWPRTVEKVSGAGAYFATDHAAGVLTDESYFDYKVAPKRQVVARRLTPADTRYFATDVYPLLTDRLPAADVRPLEFLQAKLQDGVTPPRYFFVVEGNSRALAVLYCRDEQAHGCVFVSYLVVSKPEPNVATDKISQLLLRELRDLARRRRYLVMELAHPGYMADQSAYIESISRMRLFTRFARDFGFEILALDLEYLQPALRPAEADIPHLLAIGRQFSTTGYSMSPTEAAVIVGATYGGYAADAEPALARRSQLLQEQIIGSLSGSVTLLNFQKVMERWPAPNRSLS
jgi:hypothetical protein